MNSNPYSEQFDQQVLFADPIELVGIIFDHLLGSIAEAREHLRSGDRMARAHSIGKAIGLIGELSHSLDNEKGGELSRTLNQIYAFAVSSLVEAHSNQSEKPMIEAAEALRPLRDAWAELHQMRANQADAAISEVYTETVDDAGMRFAISA